MSEKHDQVCGECDCWGTGERVTSEESSEREACELYNPPTARAVLGSDGLEALLVCPRQFCGAWRPRKTSLHPAHVEYSAMGISEERIRRWWPQYRASQGCPLPRRGTIPDKERDVLVPMAEFLGMQMVPASERVQAALWAWILEFCGDGPCPQLYLRAWLADRLLVWLNERMEHEDAVLEQFECGNTPSDAVLSLLREVLGQCQQQFWRSGIESPSYWNTGLRDTLGNIRSAALVWASDTPGVKKMLRFMGLVLELSRLDDTIDTIRQFRRLAQQCEQVTGETAEVEAEQQLQDLQKKWPRMLRMARMCPTSIQHCECSSQCMQGDYNVEVCARDVKT